MSKFIKTMTVVKYMLALLILLSGYCLSVNIAQAASYKGFIYEDKNGGIVLTDYFGGKSKVIIPQKINGKQVTTLGKGLFKTNYRIKKIVIPEGVDTIEDMALYDLQNLDDISFPSTLKEFNVNSYFGFYSEASDFPNINIRVIKGSPAYKYIMEEWVIIHRINYSFFQ